MSDSSEVYNSLEDPAAQWKGPHWKYTIRTSTSTLRDHLKRLHKEIYYKAVKEKGWIKLQPGLRTLQQALAVKSVAGPRVPFSSQAMVTAMIRFIVSDDQVRYLLYYTSFV